MSQMRHSDLESQFLFQIVDVDVREKAGSNLLYCNITCLRVDKVQF